MKNIRLQIAVSLMTLVSAVPSVALAQAEVEQWGRFEQTFKGPSEGNPFHRCAAEGRLLAYGHY